MRRLLGALPPLLCLLLGTIPEHVAAAEVYSWIDQSGIVVMTDDPGQIPPATQRHSLSIHRFETDAPAGVRSADSGVSEEPRGPVRREVPRDVAESRPAPTVSDDAEDSDVVLKMTDDLDRDSYVWMPLQTPIAFGSEVIDGFWWHPGVTSPVDAFKAYLRRHRRPVPKGSWLSTAPQSGRQRKTQETFSGNSVYDQVVRERQLLIQRNGLLFGPPPVAPPSAAAQRPDPGLKAPR